MIDIHQYTNYRKFLRDYYEDRKREDKKFSYRYWSTRAGFSTKTFLYRILKGEKSLSKDSIFKVGNSMRLEKREMEYFQCMVHFNEATTLKEREYYFKQLQAINIHKKLVKLKNHQLEYYSHWYNIVIRDYVSLQNGSCNPKEIAAGIIPPVEQAKVEKSLKLLGALGLLKKLASGRYKAVDQFISTGDEIASVAIPRYHKDMLKIASESIDTVPDKERDYSNISFSISKKGFEKIKAELQWFRKHILKIIEEDGPAGRVCQLNIQLFPSTKKGKNW